jgi:hypothetical protein
LLRFDYCVFDAKPARGQPNRNLNGLLIRVKLASVRLHPIASTLKGHSVTARKAESATEAPDQTSSAVEGEIDNLVRKDFRSQRSSAPSTATEVNTESLSSLIARVAGHSTTEIDSLIAELQQVRNYLHDESERVQRKINEFAQMNQSALASIKVIADAVGPWKSAALDKQPAKETAKEPPPISA